MWSKEEMSYRFLKNLVKYSVQVLALFNSVPPVIASTDASHYGAVLLQIHPNQTQHTVGFATWTPKKYQSNKQPEFYLF